MKSHKLRFLYPLIAVILMVYNRRTPREILETDVRSIFEKLGLNQHLSNQRKNGLAGMVKRIRRIAGEHLDSLHG